MELNTFISNCRNPKMFTNKNGETISVRCGVCPDCMNAKSVYYTSMVMNASQEFKYCYMATLKYDEVNVPRMYLKLVDDIYYCIDVTKRLLKTKGKFKKLKTYGKVIHTFRKDENFDEFYKRADIDSKLVAKVPFKNLRWCCKEDFQNFIKRLRFRFSQVLDSSFSFFGVSEYGPQTFRPHFHVLFFFNDGRMFQYFAKFISKSWRFGSVRCESPESNEGVCAYVASYLNSVTHLPHYLSSSTIKPRSFHSHFLGAKAHAEIRDFVYNADGYPFEKVDINSSFGTRSIIFTSSLVRTLFPRCYNFSQQTPASRYQLYSIFRDLSKRYKTTNLVKLAKYVLLYSRENYDYLYLLDLTYIDLVSPRYLQDLLLGVTPINKLERKDKSYIDIVTAYNRVYSSLLLSRHVFDFCLEKYSPDYLWSFIKKIDDFYLQREKHLLHKQLLMQEEYAKVNPCPTINPNVDLSTFSFFDLLKLCSFQEKLSIEHFSIFYPVQLDYDKIYRHNRYMKNLNREKDFKYKEKVKHKELNDANLIFVD